MSRCLSKLQGGTCQSGFGHTPQLRESLGSRFCLLVLPPDTKSAEKATCGSWVPVEVLSRSPVGTIFPDFRRVACRCLNLGKDQKDLSQRHGELIEQREAPTQMFVEGPVVPNSRPEGPRIVHSHEQGAMTPAAHPVGAEFPNQRE